MTSAGGLMTARLFQSRPETPGLDLEMLAGSCRLDQPILSPYTQKTDSGEEP